MDSVIPGDETSDADLVARLREGDEQAFNTLVRRHQQRALNVAFQVLRDAEDAAEVAQDAFVKVYRNIGQFRGDAAFTTWLHQIVMNLARNRYRWWKRRGKQAMISLDEPIEGAEGSRPRELAIDPASPDREAERDEFVDRVAVAMGELPAKYREVLVLRNVEELSYEQIAAVLGCSIGTVKSRIARARETLKTRVMRGQG